MHDPYGALYIHVPFCASRCGYCDFATQAVPHGDARIDAYFERLVLDVRRAAKQGELSQVKTVYVGGGTPSFAGSKNLSMLFYTLGLSMHLTDEVEVSMEANPESLDARLVRDLWALGVNRLSIGVQSFDDGLLRTLGRAHDADGARRAVKAAHERFENVSVDLMCGLPGQSTERFVASVKEAVSLGVTHVSVYPLTIEEHTPFYRMLLKGQIGEVDDDVEAEMMEAAERELASAGFERYEVASYARPGFECRHNTAYWTGVPYLGIGDSAATMTQNAERRMRVQDGRVTDDLNARQMATEDLMLGMRLVRGVPDAQVEAASKLAPGVPQVLRDLEKRGLVRHADGRWRPTRKGWLCGNELYGALMDA